MKECPTPRNALKHIVKLLLKILLLKGSKDEWYGSFASYQILENERPRGLPFAAQAALVPSHKKS